MDPTTPIKDDPDGGGNNVTGVKVVLGAMTLGKEGAEAARVHSLTDCVAMLDVLQKHGHNEVDTARVYGASEELLGQLNWQERGIVMATKLNPRPFGPNPYSHRKADLERGLRDSLRALKADRVDLWYLHTPDHTTPYDETLEAVNELYKAGLFRRFGISYYAAWEVARICEMCERNGWKKPDVYQGCYHALQRAVETELFPCLRHYGIAFYAFSPLAGGLFTGKYRRDTTKHEPGSRFDPSRRQGRSFRGRYWNDAYFNAIEIVQPVTQKLSIPTARATVKWLKHHSALRADLGDAIIVGASSAAQFKENLISLEDGGPLPEELVTAFDKGWAAVKGVCEPYYL